jgi:citrate lyase subunit beta/citryl-CoA lyase
MIAVRAFSKLSIDTVYLQMDGLEGQRREARDAAARRALRLPVASIHHESRLSKMHTSRRMSRLSGAAAVLAEAKDKRGVFSFHGEMVDPPVLRQANSIVSRYWPTA